MKDDFTLLQKLQNQRYAVEDLRAPVEGYLRWMLIYTTKIEGIDHLDFQDHVVTHPCREACIADLLEAINSGEEICWYNLFEAKDYIQTYYNIDHTDEKVRNEFRRDMEIRERFCSVKPKTITLAQEIEDYIAEEIAHTQWLEEILSAGEKG